MATLIDILVDSNGKPIVYNNKVLSLVLPTEYTKVSYLESQGNEYLNTGFIPQADFKHTVIFEVVSNNNNSRYIFGSGISEGRSGNLRISGSTLNGLFIGDNTSGGAVNLIANQDITLNTKYTIMIDLHQNATNTVKLNGVSIGNSSTTTIVSPSQMQYFALGSNNLSTGVRIYSSKIEQNNKVIHYFIPVRRTSDQKLGMYDLITRVFKVGPGNFITEE